MRRKIKKEYPNAGNRKFESAVGGYEKEVGAGVV
jgi:hypothetical protein